MYIYIYTIYIYICIKGRTISTGKLLTRSLRLWKARAQMCAFNIQTHDPTWDTYRPKKTRTDVGLIQYV